MSGLWGVTTPVQVGKTIDLSMSMRSTQSFARSRREEELPVLFFFFGLVIGIGSDKRGGNFGDMRSTDGLTIRSSDHTF